MLTGNLVRVRAAKLRIIPLYIHRENQEWLEVAESLLLLFREGIGRTRSEIESEFLELVGEDPKTLIHRGLAKVLEDRAEFEIVSDVPPDELRERVFAAAAAVRKSKQMHGVHQKFKAYEVLKSVGDIYKITPEKVEQALFADLKDENRLLRFEDMTAQRLIDRYNVALAQAVLLRSTLVTVEVRHEKPARYRQIFRRLKFHRLLYRLEGSMLDGYTLNIDGPLSLFTSTNKYGLQMAMFMPALLHCADFRLNAELRWGPKREPRSFQLDNTDGLVTHSADEGQFVPAEVPAFIERFRQVAPEWDVEESNDIIELGREGVWVPDYRFVHKNTGIDVLVEIVGFWKRSSIERLLRLLPKHGPKRFVLAISERLKVDEEALENLPGSVLRFKEIPNANELAGLLDQCLEEKTPPGWDS